MDNDLIKFYLNYTPNNEENSFNFMNKNPYLAYQKIRNEIYSRIDIDTFDVNNFDSSINTDVWLNDHESHEDTNLKYVNYDFNELYILYENLIKNIYSMNNLAIKRSLNLLDRDLLNIINGLHQPSKDNLIRTYIKNFCHMNVDEMKLKYLSLLLCSKVFTLKIVNFLQKHNNTLYVNLKQRYPNINLEHHHDFLYMFKSTKQMEHDNFLNFNKEKCLPFIDLIINVIDIDIEIPDRIMAIIDNYEMRNGVNRNLIRVEQNLNRQNRDERIQEQNEFLGKFARQERIIQTHFQNIPVNHVISIYYKIWLKLHNQMQIDEVQRMNIRLYQLLLRNSILALFFTIQATKQGGIILNDDLQSRIIFSSMLLKFYIYKEVIDFQINEEIEYYERLKGQRYTLYQNIIYNGLISKKHNGLNRIFYLETMCNLIRKKKRNNMITDDEFVVDILNKLNYKEFPVALENDLTLDSSIFGYQFLYLNKKIMMFLENLNVNSIKLNKLLMSYKKGNRDYYYLLNQIFFGEKTIIKNKENETINNKLYYFLIFDLFDSVDL